MKVKKLTIEWLIEEEACPEAVEEFKNQPETDPLKILKALLKNKEKDHLYWANWLIVRLMTRPQYLAYAIYASGQVIGIYEEKYPDDDQPRLAIEASKAVLRNDTPENRAIAWAARAALAAGDVWADRAALAARDAALDTAGAAGDARPPWAALAARDAARDAAGADRAATGNAEDNMMIRIIKYGIGLLEKETNKDWTGSIHQ